MKQLQNPMPTLERAKELTKHLKRPLGNTTILINSVAPTVTSTGMIIGDDAQKAHQTQMNKEGMLVVSSPFKREKTDESNPDAFFEGEKVVFRRNSEASGTILLHTEERLEGLTLPPNYEENANIFKAYVVLIMDSFNVICVVD